jgi:hypothetical protein
MSMEAAMLRLLVFAFLLSFIEGVGAERLVETSTGPFDEVDCCSSHIDSDQFMGARFRVEKKTRVTSIGGHFLAHGSIPIYGGSIFGAIVRLNEAGFPSDNYLTLANVVATTVFVPIRGNNVVPLPTTLESGNYAVVFGSGLFGAKGKRGLTLLQPAQAAGKSSGEMIMSLRGESWVLGETPNRYRVFVECELDASASSEGLSMPLQIGPHGPPPVEPPPSSAWMFKPRP